MVDVKEKFNDEPIEKPKEDSFGVDRLARAIADCIHRLRKPVGSVIAINGPWGAGKSSVINLVCHHLGKKKSRKSNIITFHCWWYRGEEALTLGFFKELYRGLSPASSEIKEMLPRLGALVAAAGSLIETIAAPVGGGGTVKVATDLLRNYISDDDSVEELQHTVYKALENQKQRFLVIIDDLDRLPPDEVLLIFRLIKSVGRLPQITYLISYDREIVEQAITERYPSEGGKHYLEKMVQARFEIPMLEPARLNGMMRNQIDKIFENAEDPGARRLHDIFDKAVMPELRTPRDVVRLGNTLSVTWGAVQGKVNTADFVCLETLRLFRPDLYRALGGNKSGLTDPNGIPRGRAEYYDRLLLPSVSKEPEEVRDRLRDIVTFLFPPLGEPRDDDNQPDTEDWLKERRVCASDYFDTYFRFNPPPMLVSREEIDEIIRRSDDSGFIKKTFKDALLSIQREGQTKTSCLLDILISHEDDFSDGLVGPFIKTMFSMADLFCKEFDYSDASLYTSNSIRFLQLTQTLTRNRFTLEERSCLLRTACETASPGWLVYFSYIAYRQYAQREDDFRQSPDEILMTEEHVDEVRDLTLQKIHAARDDGTLVDLPDLLFILSQWEEMDEGEDHPVKHWMDQILKQDEDVGRLANAFLGGTWDISGRGGVDGVKSRVRVQIDDLEWIMDSGIFKRRFEGTFYWGRAISGIGRDNIRHLLEAWEKDSEYLDRMEEYWEEEQEDDLMERYD